MIKKNIIIAALARDCESALKINIPIIEEFRKQILWSNVIVVENDSIDSTKEILRNWESNYFGINVISKNYGIKTIPDKSDLIISPMTSFQRIEKMVEYRNLYIDFIQNIDHEIDILIVIDIDVKEISLDGLINAVLAIDDKTGGIFSNGITIQKYFGFISKIYFDTFAVYEYPIFDKFSYTQKSLDKTFKSVNKKIKKNNYYKVISAFSGVGVYNYKAIKDLKYKTVLNPLNNKEAICEHIPFNIDIVKRGYSNYISRDFQVVYGAHNLGLIFKLLIPSILFNLLYPIIKKYN
jgi:hypothetical protein